MNKQMYKKSISFFDGLVLKIDVVQIDTSFQIDNGDWFSIFFEFEACLKEGRASYYSSFLSTTTLRTYSNPNSFAHFLVSYQIDNGDWFSFFWVWSSPKNGASELHSFVLILPHHFIHSFTNSYSRFFSDELIQCSVYSTSTLSRNPAARLHHQTPKLN